jgi:hypothetical protein
VYGLNYLRIYPNLLIGKISPFRSYIGPILPNCIKSINLEEQDMGDWDTRISIKMLNDDQVNDSKL